MFYYTAALSKNFVNTDIFDTLLWAKASYESGKIIAPDFYYSAFLPFGGSLLMLPFIKFFGVSFTTHVIGMILFEVIFLISFVLFFKKIGFNANWIMISLIANNSLWMFADKFREMFLEHIIYYSLSALFILIGYTLISSFIESLNSAQNRKKTIILGVVVFIFFTLVATDGFQIVGLATVPIIAAVVCERFFDLKTKLFSKDNRAEIIAVILIGTATVAGLLIIKKLLDGSVSEYASAYSQYDTNNHIYMYPAKIKNFIDCWYQLFEVFFISGISISDLSQLPVLLTAATATVLLATVPITAIFYKKIESKHIRLLFWTAFFVFTITLALWIVGTITGVEWRLIPTVFLSMILLLADLKLLFDNVGTKRITVAILVLMLLSSYPSVNYLIAYSPVGEYGSYDATITKLNEYSVTQGYGNYWYVGCIDVITSEKIKSAFAGFGTDQELHIAEYQQSKNVRDGFSDESSTYLLLEHGQVEAFEKSKEYENSKNDIIDIFEVGGEHGYTVYIYNHDIYGTIIKP